MLCIWVLALCLMVAADALRTGIGAHGGRLRVQTKEVRSLHSRRMAALGFTPSKKNDVDNKDDTSLEMSEAINTANKDDRRQNLSAIQRVLDFYKEYSNRESVNGFTDISELINGRLAMVGLIAGYSKEYFTGETFLQQVGIGAPKWEGLAEISEDIGVAMLVTFFVVTFSVFNQRAPKDGEIKI